jgi:uncharacterized small protein (DUF1192 family)
LGETPAANPDATADREHSTAPSDTADADSLRELEEVVAQVEVLREENRRLRAEYVRAHQSAYRRAALALLVFGGLAAGGGLVFPGLRATLFGLAGIGGFIAILVYYLTPQRVATATVGERADATRAQLEAAISADLGLQDTYVYVPTLADDPVGGAARLFVPLHTTYTVPEPEALGSVFVVDSADQTRGVSLPPTGALLLAECRQTMIDDLATTPDALLEQLTEALVAGFELAGDAVADVDATDGTATVGVRDSTFGAVDRFDHPLPSFVATGLAVGLQTPVERAVITTESADFDYVLTYMWDADAGETEVAETATQ